MRFTPWQEHNSFLCYLVLLTTMMLSFISCIQVAFLNEQSECWRHNYRSKTGRRRRKEKKMSFTLMPVWQKIIWKGKDGELMLGDESRKAGGERKAMRQKTQMYGICLSYPRSQKWQSLDNSSCGRLAHVHIRKKAILRMRSFICQMNM